MDLLGEDFGGRHDNRIDVKFLGIHEFAGLLLSLEPRLNSLGNRHGASLLVVQGRQEVDLVFALEVLLKFDLLVPFAGGF